MMKTAKNCMFLLQSLSLTSYQCINLMNWLVQLDEDPSHQLSSVADSLRLELLHLRHWISQRSSFITYVFLYDTQPGKQSRDVGSDAT